VRSAAGRAADTVRFAYTFAQPEPDRNANGYSDSVAGRPDAPAGLPDCQGW
jgi:hypothetical protein